MGRGNRGYLQVCVSVYGYAHMFIHLYMHAPPYKSVFFSDLRHELVSLRVYIFISFLKKIEVESGHALLIGLIHHSYVKLVFAVFS